MARRFRLWEKKRGDRRTGSKLIGTAGEALFFGSIFLFGLISLAALSVTDYLTNPATGSWALWAWLVILVLLSLIGIGAGGVIYTILLVGTTAERRRALAKRATDIDLLADTLPSPRDFPNVPRDVNLTNSPGVHLAYRLPMRYSPGWQLLATGIFTLVWNGMVSVLLVLAVNQYLNRRPDWYLTILIVPFAAIGVAAIYQFLRLLLLATAIGPTNLEISELPLYPGGSYQVHLTQAGRLTVEKLQLSLVCDEEVTYQQGTDTRTEHRRTYHQPVFARENFQILPGFPLEHACQFSLPQHVMHSFHSEHNAVHWKLVVEGTIEKWPRFQRSFPVVVYPASGSGGPGSDESGT